MNAMKIYSDQMAKRMRGTALYEPKWEVYVGDVGYIRNGRFFRLFNITLPRDHQLQRKGVPSSFVPFGVEQWSQSAEPDFLQPQVLHSESVSKKEINVELEWVNHSGFCMITWGLTTIQRRHYTDRCRN
jgi:hypothetical protein